MGPPKIPRFQTRTASCIMEAHHHLVLNLSFKGVHTALGESLRGTGGLRAPAADKSGAGS